MYSFSKLYSNFYIIKVWVLIKCIFYWRVELNTVAMMHILRHYTHINTYRFFFSFFRDNGITVQILKYQLYCEGFMFLLVLFVSIIPIGNDVLVSSILGILYNFVVFVIQPLFYLSGDVNFRNRFLQQNMKCLGHFATNKDFLEA